MPGLAKVVSLGIFNIMNMKKILIGILFIFVFQISFAQTENVGITFEFANGEIVTQNSQEYYAFDIMASASEDNTYFGSGMVYINYNTYAFGENVCTAENIFVEKGELIQGELSQGVPLYEIVNIIDNTYSRIAITTDYNFPQLADEANMLSTDPIQFLHIQLKVENITGYSGLSFEQDLMENQQYQSDNTNRYSPVVATDTDNTDLPVAQKKDNIEDFSGSHILTHPNPFDSHISNIELRMLAPKSGNMSLKVYNIKGQFISKIYEDFHQKNDIVNSTWNGTNFSGQKLSSGVYLFQLLVDKETYDSKKILLIR